MGAVHRAGTSPRAPQSPGEWGTVGQELPGTGTWMVARPGDRGGCPAPARGDGGFGVHSLGMGTGWLQVPEHRVPR